MAFAYWMMRTLKEKCLNNYRLLIYGEYEEKKLKTAAGWVNYPNILKLKNNNQTEFQFSTLFHGLDEMKPMLH
jgi:hypothetical protein